MKIAYYGVGNVADPLGVIHDEKGELLLEQDEKIVIKKENIRCQIIIKRGLGLLDFPIFDDTGIGTLYTTNKRIIYIREAQPFEHLGKGVVTTGGIGDFLSPLWAKDWKKMGRKECFAIPITSFIGTHRKARWGMTRWSIIGFDIYAEMIRLAGWKKCKKAMLRIIKCSYSDADELLGKILKDKPVLR